MWQWNAKEEETYRQAVQDKLDRILEQTTATNGRLRTAEKAIIVLQWGYGLGAALLVWYLYRL